MPTAVTISIVVDSAQAQTGTNANVAFQKAGTSVQQLGGHTTTSLDAVRLLSQEFGLRLPRALESMISRMSGLSSAINGVVGGLAGIAAIEVFAKVGEGAYKLYNQYISLNAEADKFYETLKKTAQEDIANTRSIETTRRRSGDATGNATTALSSANALQSNGLQSFSNPAQALAMLIAGKQVMELGTQAQGDMIKLGKVNLDQAHEQALAQIDLNHALDGSLVGLQKINAEAAKKKQIDAENRSFNRKEEMFYGNVSPGDAGATEQRMKDSQADQEANAQKIVLGREASLAVMKAQDETVQAGLEGDALYEQKRSDGIREITAQLQSQGKGEQQILAETAAFAARLDDERSERLEKQWHDAQQAQRTASQSGLTGAGRVTADFGNRLDQINSDRSLDPAAAAQLRIAAKTEEDQKLKELSDNFTSAQLASTQTRTEAELGGLAKIEAEAQRATELLRKAYDAAYKDSNGNDVASPSQRASLSSAQSGITADANRKRAELAEQNNAEDLQYAQQAADAEKRVKEEGILGWVAAYKNGIADINAEDERRTARMEEQAAKQGATQEQIAARKVEIDRTANAQIEQQNLQMQHQIAGDLQQAFAHPVDYIKSAMEKMFFEIVASWVMQMDGFQALFGNKMGALQPGGGGAGAAAGAGSVASGTGGLISRLTHGAGGAFNGSPQQTTYGSTSGTSGGGASGGGTISSGGTSSAGGSSFGSTLSGVGSLAQTVANIPGLGGGAGAPSGLTTDEHAFTDTIPDAPAPGVSPTLASIGGFGDPTIAGAVSQIPGAIGAGMGAFQAEQSTVKAYESGNVLQGALGDASAGAAIGGLAGPEGAAIGAGVGAAVGAAAGLIGMIGGEGGKLAARDYYNKSVFPTLNAAATNSNYGDFQSAINSVDQTSGQAMSYMRAHFGSDAANWVNDNYMKKEVQKADSMISNSAEGGRQFTQMSAMQFHTGGTISGFGSFATSDNEGFIHAAMGETVMTPGASAVHGPALAAMNAGASASDVAGAYLGSTARGSAMPSSSGGDQHYHIHTLDTKTMTSWLRGGGAKMITKEQNNYNAQYAGDGIGG